MHSSISRSVTACLFTLLLVLGICSVQQHKGYSEQPVAVRQTDFEQILSAFQQNPDYLLPTPCEQAKLVRHHYYTLSYQEPSEQAQWVAYQLTADHITSRAARKDNFRADPTVPTGSADPRDYRNSGYDMGHLKPAADAAFSQDAMDETFFMSNMSPQVPGFNRGIWKHLEDQVRKWVRVDQPLYIITGPIIADGAKTIGPNQVAVPQAYFKVVLDYTMPDIKGIGFILENKKSNQPLKTYACSIDHVEQVTNLDFFPQLPDPIEDQVESTGDFSAWSPTTR